MSRLICNVKVEFGLLNSLLESYYNSVMYNQGQKWTNKYNNIILINAIMPTSSDSYQYIERRKCVLNVLFMEHERI